MLDISSSDGKEVAAELTTNLTFIKGTCGNKFSKDSKPRIYNFTQDSFEKHHGIPSMVAVLNQCLGRAEDDVVILVNNMVEVNLVQSALHILGKTSKEYVPYLRHKFPTTEQKQDLLEELNSDNELILLSDYRSFRGCEASHSIILTDFDKPIGANIMAEMLSRTMADLDFIVLPKKNPTCYFNPITKFFNIIAETFSKIMANLGFIALPKKIVNPIKKSFDTWEEDGLVQTTTVKFHYEKRFSIYFKLHNSCKENPCKEIPCKEDPCKENPCKENPIEIEIPSSGFDILQYNEDQESKSYLWVVNFLTYIVIL